VRRGWLVVALLLSLGVNLGLVGTAFARRRGFERGPERRLEALRDGLPERPGGRIAEQLGLDRAQGERFVDAHRRMMKRVFEARFDIGRVRSELRHEVAARSPEPARIDELLRELSAAEAALNRAVVDGILEARAELAPGQARDYLRLLEQLGPPGAGFERRGSRGGERPPFARRFDGPPPRRGEPTPEPEAAPPEP
jgi:hypothetical protein